MLQGDSTQTVGVGHETDHIVVPYEIYQLYDWGKVPELYVTL